MMGEEKVEERTMEIYTEIKSSFYRVARREEEEVPCGKV